MLHGGIFWAIRRRQRRIRQQAILEIREMLADVVKNQLAIIGMWLPGKDRTMYEEQIEWVPSYSRPMPFTIAVQGWHVKPGTASDALR